MLTGWATGPGRTASQKQLVDRQVAGSQPDHDQPDWEKRKVATADKAVTTTDSRAARRIGIDNESEVEEIVD